MESLAQPLTQRLMKIAAFIFFSLLAMTIANAAEQTPANATGQKADKKSDQKPSEKAEKPVKPTLATSKIGKAPLPKDVKKLIVEDTIVGNGKAASKGKKIKVQYTGWLYDPAQPMGRGKQFATSVGKEPFTFPLGGGDVIKGWDDGFDNMKVGGKRKLIIPSELSYGSRGAGNDAIPPNSALMYEVELLDVN